jgi:ligand-binding SRPBCC domain-containing protein
MRVYTLRREQTLGLPVDEVFAFFSEPANLEDITPGWLRFRILTPRGIQMGAGTHIRYALRWRGLPLSWTTRITEWEPPNGFVDVQRHGPYRFWEHTHTFEPVKGGTLVRDVVRYALPLGVLGRLAHAGWVQADLNAIFDYRARKVTDLLGASVGI